MKDSTKDLLQVTHATLEEAFHAMSGKDDRELANLALITAMDYLAAVRAYSKALSKDADDDAIKKANELVYCEAPLMAADEEVSRLDAEQG
jgi:hypothetical protein